MGEDEVSGGLRIQIAPAVLVIGTSTAHVVGGIDQKSLECAGPNTLTRKLAGVELLDENGGTNRIGRGHAGAAVGAVVGSGAGDGAGGGREGHARVKINAIGGEVRFDAAVVTGAFA